MSVRRLRRWTRRGALGGLAVALLLATVGPARGVQTLVADLSEHLVAITMGFAGAEVLLFGAIDGPGDVVVVVQGPKREVRMHRKSRVLGVWANTATMTFESVPSYYAVNASGPLDEIALPQVRARQQMGLDQLRIDLPRAKASPNVADAWRAALIRAKQREGHYQDATGDVTFLGDRLFRADIRFPANVPTGSYTVETYLLREGRVVSAQTTPLIVGKVGMEADLFDFAYERPALYGLVAILIALVAGWLAHSVFRKD
jgi:uncharacterized protein (TIGR02186 family)